MKKCLLACLLVLFAATARAEDPLRLLADRDFAPYSMVIDGVPSGIDVDVFTEAARRAGLEIEIQARPLETVLERVQNGRCDGALALFRSPGRERYALFMEATPIHYSDYVLFTKVGAKFPFNSYQDLAGKVIGLAAGLDLGPEFAAARAKGDMLVKEYPDQRAILAGLLGGEIDAFAGNIDVTYYRLKAMGLTSSVVYLNRKLLTGKPSYAVLSRAAKRQDKEEIIQALEKALDQMAKDGTYNAIARRYLLRF
ncbi:putative ABC transporter arginine-binding protein 2 precursor [Pseudodesulfovibrio hydrargyri]|uniref:Putative ABC transporter arginine-binding protein 2 n=1 Tax=Pseudodesulfovibrio hydrargyri TaxID=2125990 RepID=A0A1J5N2D7_9BACT|nr:transporter substrate-binding domain-containing protein [Pseudodesulfovibrio hydrargyri]OIQ49787.1 putative ABC transporter arginine-binding protein 2 precursor [Pseudodesulfovibrio hydrargyri]